MYKYIYILFFHKVKTIGQTTIFTVEYKDLHIRVPTSLVTQHSMYFPGYFQVKAMKSKVNLASNQCLC